MVRRLENTEAGTKPVRWTGQFLFDAMGKTFVMFS